MKTQILLGLVLLCLNFKGFTQTIPAYDPATDATDIAYQNRMRAIFENSNSTVIPIVGLHQEYYKIDSLAVADSFVIN